MGFVMPLFVKSGSPSEPYVQPLAIGKYEWYPDRQWPAFAPSPISQSFVPRTGELSHSVLTPIASKYPSLIFCVTPPKSPPFQSPTGSVGAPFGPAWLVPPGKKRSTMTSYMNASVQSKDAGWIQKGTKRRAALPSSS